MARGIMIDGVIINKTGDTRNITVEQVYQEIADVVKKQNLNSDFFTTDPISDIISIKSGSISEVELDTEVIAKLNYWERVNLGGTEDVFRFYIPLDFEMQDKKINNVSDIDFNSSSTSQTHEYKEGRMYYNKDLKRMIYYNDISDVAISLGSERVIRVKNETGNTIPNGTVVYPTGSTGDITTIEKANCVDYEKSRLVGITTTEILDGEEGEVTKAGCVNDIDTSSFTKGDLLYLSSVDGEITNVLPNGESYITTLGVCEVSDPVNGSIVVDISTTHLSAEVTDTNGFSSEQRDSTSLSFNNSTREFIISASSAYSFYQDGLKYRKQSPSTVVLPDLEGLYAIYFDLGILSYTRNPTKAEISQIIITKPLVAYVYYDANLSQSIFIADERHGISMDPVTHANLHFTRGTQLLYGLGLGDIVADGNGGSDTQHQFSVSGGVIADEDINTSIGDISQTHGIPAYYMLGSDNMRRHFSSGKFFMNDPVTERVYYNNNNAGNWELQAVPNGGYVLYHIFATNSYDDENKVISIMGQNEYNKLSDAREGASSEIKNIKSMLPFEELVAIGTIILLTRNNYTNSGKASIQSDSDGNDYIDWRASSFIRGTNPSSHDDLTNVYNVGDGVAKGHLSDTAETIYGVKTFHDGLVADISHGDLSNVELAGNGVALGHISNTTQTIYGSKTFHDGINIPSVVTTFGGGTNIIDTTSGTAQGIIYNIRAYNSVGDIKVGNIYICYSSTNGISLLDNTTGFGDVVFSAEESSGNINLKATTSVNNWTMRHRKELI